jgi:hypothetical protein
MSISGSSTEQSNIEKLHKSLGVLIEITKNLDPEYSMEINELLENAIKDASEITGKFLHKLHIKKTDPAIVKKMIAAFPTSLCVKNERHRLPINTAAWHTESVRYVPFLANEGIKRNIIDMGDSKRGGLLVEPKRIGGMNVLKLLSRSGMVPSCEEPYLETMQELRRSKLFLYDDIRDYDLLFWSCTNAFSPLRFDYLAELDPEALKDDRFRDQPIIHAITKFAVPTLFPKILSTFLKTSLKHHPKELGLLFQKNENGETACECILSKCGKIETFKAIGECIPFSDTQLPILHHVVQNAPQLLNEFTKYYPSAAYLRDSSGRKLCQKKLACGNLTYENDAMFFVGKRDVEIAEVDPGTDLYPFMVAASGDTSDLSAVYYLLRRNPALANPRERRRLVLGRRKRKL